MSTKKEKSESKAFKDWFDQTAARRLAEQTAQAWPEFDRKTFLRLATKKLNTLEMMGRVQLFSDAWRTTLPDDIPQALAILVKSLPPVMPDCEATTDGYLQWPMGCFIADHGLGHLDESFAAMTELTKRFSSEFAVRPFVEHHQEETFRRLQALTADPNPHVRRWSSEGTRPRLPWGSKLRKLVADPKPIWPILEALKDDKELYVRRSVANNLNDIAKDHPDLVVERCRAWSREGHPHRDWVIKHGLRSLIKSGHPGALKVLGYGPPKRLSATLDIQPVQVTIGESLELRAIISTTSSRAQELVVDYVVHYVRKGNNHSGKVFKWKTLRLPARGTAELRKKHSMKTTTIRALYPGVHRVEVQVNGVRVAENRFTLSEG
ncbi:MAG: 3-methyladenine DNA glycosylase AlkC [Kiritimatiellia bacterium]|jgi:3-methyladenine DNA glycosylase AlkC